MSNLVTCDTLGQGLTSWLDTATQAEKDALCDALDCDISFIEWFANASQEEKDALCDEVGDCMESTINGLIKGINKNKDNISDIISGDITVGKAENSLMLDGYALQDILTSDVTTDLNPRKYSTGDVKLNGVDLTFDDLDVNTLPLGLYAPFPILTPEGVEKEKADGSLALGRDDPTYVYRKDIKNGLLSIAGKARINSQSNNRNISYLLDVKVSRAGDGRLERQIVEATGRSESIYGHRWFRSQYGGSSEDYLTRWYLQWTDGTAKPDTNGVLTLSSAFMRIYNDRHKFEDVNFPATVERIAKGMYKVSNTYGFTDGDKRVSIPEDDNGNRLLHVSFDVDGDAEKGEQNITVKTCEPVFVNGHMTGGEAKDIPEGRHLVIIMKEKPEDE